MMMNGKAIIGLTMIIVGVPLGLYIGVWVCFVGGIWTLVQMVGGSIDMAFTTFAWATTKIVLAGFFGWISAIVLVLPGMALID